MLYQNVEINIEIYKEIFIQKEKNDALIIEYNIICPTLKT